MVADLSLAQANVLAQQEMIQQLEAARIVSGRSVDEVAALLGVEPSMVQQSLSGERDLTLTELRLLAFAVDAVVEYEVESTAEGES